MVDVHDRLRSTRIPAAALLLAAIVVALSGCVDTQLDAHFATAGEARNAGYVDRGWIPSWIPAGATDLHESHDVDTNSSMLAFSLPDPGTLVLPDTCRAVEHTHILPPPLERAWWPQEESLRTSYVFFRCPAEHTAYRFVGMSLQQARVLYWRTHGK